MSQTQQIRSSLESTLQSVKKATSSTVSVFQATTYSSSNSLVTESRIRDFSLKLDEPRELGGENSAPNPVEAVLAALGSCQEIVYRAYAALLGIRIDTIEVDVQGDLDLRGIFNVADVPAGLTRVRYATRIVSPEPNEKLQELVRLVESHCPVLDTLRRPIEVGGEVRLLPRADNAAVA